MISSFPTTLLCDSFMTQHNITKMGKCGKMAKFDDLIGKLQWGNGHPDTWLGILIFGGISHLLATQT